MLLVENIMGEKENNYGTTYAGIWIFFGLLLNISVTYFLIKYLFQYKDKGCEYYEKISYNG